MKLAITQIVPGVLIVVSLFLFADYVIPGYYQEMMIDSNGNVIGCHLEKYYPCQVR